MTSVHTILVLSAAFLAVFCQASVPWFRSLLGVQIDLLPALMVYTGLSGGLTTVCLLALAGGLWQDSLSANPLGLSVLPLFVVGIAVYSGREVVLRDQTFARWTLGLGASIAAPVLSLLLLLSSGRTPLLGWGTLWQLAVMGLAGGFATPLVFWLLAWLQTHLSHGRVAATSFRHDREIRRGRG